MNNKQWWLGGFAFLMCGAGETANAASPNTDNLANAATSSSAAACKGFAPALSATGDKWQNAAQSAATGVVRVEVPARPSTTRLNGLVGFSGGPIDKFSDMQATVRFAESGFVEARNGNDYSADASFPYEAGQWYNLALSLDVPASTYDVEISSCGGKPTKLISGARFRSDAVQIGALADIAAWAPANGTLELGTVAWSGTPCEGDECEVEPQTTSGPFPTAESTGITEEHCPDWESKKKNTEGRVVRTDGEVIEYEHINGRLQIEANDVTVRCVKIDSNSHFSLECGKNCGDGLLVENVEADNSPAGKTTVNSGTLALLSRSATVIRSHFHGACDTAKVDSGLVRDSLFDNDFVCSSDGHNDSWQSLGSSGPIWFLNNTLKGREKDQTAAAIIQGHSKAVKDVTLIGNLFFGGNYSLYLRGPRIPDDIRVHGNTWIKDSYKYGPTSIESNGPAQCIEWQDNQFEDASEVQGPSGAAANCSGISPVPTWRIADAKLSEATCGAGECDAISVTAQAEGTATSGAPSWRYQCGAGELWQSYASCDGQSECEFDDICDYSGADAGDHEIRVYSESGPGSLTRESDIAVLPLTVE